MSIIRFLVQVIQRWKQDRGLGMGAALSYFALLSLPSFLILLFSTFSAIFGQEALQRDLLPFLRQRLNPHYVELIQYFLFGRKSEIHNIWNMGLLGAFALIFGAAGFFDQLRESIQNIWGEKISEASPKAFLIEQFLDVILGMIFLASIIISMSSRILFRLLMTGQPAQPIESSLLTTVGLMAFQAILLGLVAAVLYKILPRKKSTWKDVFPGAIITGALMVIFGGFVDSYLMKQDLGQMPGMAGVVLAFLLSSFFYAQVFLVGAEVSRLIIERRRKA